MGIMPTENLSLGRYPDGNDTDNNEDDLYTNMPPSPGEPNIRGGGGDDDSKGGCGCSGDKEPSAGDGPSEAGSGLAAIAVLLTMLGLRRRETNAAS